MMRKASNHLRFGDEVRGRTNPIGTGVAKAALRGLASRFKQLYNKRPNFIPGAHTQKTLIVSVAHPQRMKDR
jgi:hypothetical protein